MIQFIYENSTPLMLVASLAILLIGRICKRRRVERAKKIIAALAAAKKTRSGLRFYDLNLRQLARLRRKHVRAMRDPRNRSQAHHRAVIAKIDFEAAMRGAFPRK